MSGLPQIGDNEDATVELLKIIAQNTGGLGDTLETELGDTIQELDGTIRPISPTGFNIFETTDLDESNPDGTVTVTPGETAVLAEAERHPGGWALFAVGANDEDDCQYQVRIDDSRTVGGTTASPLGTINSPFSFVEALGGYVPAASRVQFLVSYDASASGEVYLAGRIFVEAL